MHLNGGNSKSENCFHSELRNDFDPLIGRPQTHQAASEHAIFIMVFARNEATQLLRRPTANK